MPVPPDPSMYIEVLCMTAYLSGCLELLDDTIRAVLGVPILAAFLGAMVLASMVGLAMLLKSAAGGRGRR